MSEKRNKWTEEDMQRALLAYRQDGLGFNECCRKYNIPKPTFRRHFKALKKKANEEVKHHGRFTVFNKHMEEELSNHLLKLEENFFGVIIKDARRLAFQLVVKHKLPHNFNNEKDLAEKAWY